MSILRYEENGIEFFTLEATGESGMSQSGLARLCGVKPHAVNQLVNSVITSSSPEFLKPLQEDELTLITSANEFNNATILKDTVCACILEWYAFESQRPTEAARQAFRKFATFGIRSWIQGHGLAKPLNHKVTARTAASSRYPQFSQPPRLAQPT
jgi:integrase